ncbi:MAG: restriction endonuclease, partial [Staphylococcus equorum]|nr:restriction endonuclease [Staphylococcus equorum]
TRRAFILKFLQETKSFNSLLDKMQQKGFYDDENIIKTDINGLKTFGIHIEKDGNTVDLKDLFNNFVIPNLKVTDILQDQETEKRKAEFMRKTNLPAKYIELLDIAYDGTRNRDFEIITMELFRKVYGLNSILLGGGRKPDGLIFTNNFGVIIDTKAYKDGYSKSINQADQMIRYIEDNRKRDIDRNPTEWWVDFNHNIPDNRFYFMWISSNFIGKFHEQLEYTSSQTNTRGGSLNVEQLLLGADSVSKGYLNINNLPDYINNKEIMLVTE